MGKMVNVAVIGGGASGLVSAKYSIAEGFDVTIYEQASNLGGTWMYTDKTDKDQYGANVHSVMYQGLRTNLPKQLMEFIDHKYPEKTLPYPPQSDVLKYLQSYADRFNLMKHLKLSHSVIRIQPIENDKWEIIVKDLPNNKFETKIYDIVFVCNGHCTMPRIPKIDGASEFNGKIIHSRDFRTAEAFHADNVLIVGGGPSGVDLVMQISKVANRITFSQHKRPDETKEARDIRQSKFPSNVSLQENVKRLTPTGAEFIDGSHQTFTAIIYATGYNFKYPFLSADCGIHVDNNFVQPLYKQILNIEFPSMAFIGVTHFACNFPMYDLQAKFALKFLTGAKKLPTKSEMMMDMRVKTQIHWNKGYQKHRTHTLGPDQKDYFDDLSTTADIENIPHILLSIFFDSVRRTMSGDLDYRKYKYNVIDDKTFTCEKYME